MKTSRYYQNWLQIIARGSTLFLFLSGLFLSKENFGASVFFLLFNLASGYLSSDLKYKRYKTIVKEARRGTCPKLKKSKIYQKWLQLSGRGKGVFIFFLGLLLGRGYWTFSILLLCVQIINEIIISELVYRREQAVLRDEHKK